jgi:hypothetical protein
MSRTRALVPAAAIFAAVIAAATPTPASDDTTPPRTTTVSSTTHLNVTTPKSFDAVTAAIEKQLGKFDSAALAAAFADKLSPPEIEARIHAMEGSSGFMLFALRDHGSLLALAGKQPYAHRLRSAVERLRKISFRWRRQNRERSGRKTRGPHRQRSENIASRFTTYFSRCRKWNQRLILTRFSISMTCVWDKRSPAELT